MNRLLAFIRPHAPLVLVLASALLAVVFYFPALHYPFVSDDTGYVTENAKLAALRFPELWRLFTGPYNDFAEFLPLRELSYWFDITLFGLNPAAFRIHNIVLYLLSLPLVYAATLGVWRYFRPMDTAPWAAAAVTALFALHPALIEPVIWISGRKYVLPNLFALLAIWFAINARREHKLYPPYAVAALAAFVAVTFSKASYITVAPVIAMLWLIFWRDTPMPNRLRSQLGWPVAVMLVTMLLVLIFIASAQGYMADSGVTSPVFEFEMIARSLAVLGWLVRLAFSPEHRHYLYPVLEDNSFTVMAALGAAVLGVVAFGLSMLLRKRSLEGFALTVFFLLCLPYLQLIPYAPPSLVQDRFLALAVWPVVLLVVALVWRLQPMPRVAILLVIAMAWGIQLAERPRDWRSFETLVDSDVHAYPGYSMPAMYQTDFQLAQGKLNEAEATANSIAVPEIRSNMVKLVGAHQAVAEAISTGDSRHAMDRLVDFGHDLQNIPDGARWNVAIGIVWRINRKYLGFEWRRLAGRFPEDELLRYNAGLSLSGIQQYQGAVIHLRAAIESQRLMASLRGQAYRNLGVALLNSGHVAEAEIPLRAALEQAPPELTAYCSLASLYRQTGRIEEAVHADADCRKLPQAGPGL
ncbi:MAG: hypothetical protein HY016_11785 [Nitrosomonadales bacterium]|nr:hypothetical protein [Nitrosomonadales bacterium]